MDPLPFLKFTQPPTLCLLSYNPPLTMDVLHGCPQHDNEVHRLHVPPSLRYVALLGIPTFRDNGCPLTMLHLFPRGDCALNPTKKQASYIQHSCLLTLRMARMAPLCCFVSVIGCKASSSSERRGRWVITGSDFTSCCGLLWCCWKKKSTRTKSVRHSDS